MKKENLRVNNTYYKTKYLIYSFQVIGLFIASRGDNSQIFFMSLVSQ